MPHVHLPRLSLVMLTVVLAGCSAAVPVTRSQDVERLPAEHPCRDAALVIVDDHVPHPDTGTPTPALTVETLGELRAHPDTDWAHFGPRRVDVARWKTDDGEYALASCEMSGGGFDTRVDWWKKKVGEAANDASFYLDGMTEVNAVEYASLIWMHRPAGEEGWRTIGSEVVESNDDEGNDPQFVARAQLLSVDDADGDGTVEVAAFTLQDCRGWNRDVCPRDTPGGRDPQFVVATLVADGADALRGWTRLDARGEVLKTGEPEQPPTMSDAEFSELSARLERVRPTALERARAAIRE